MVQIKQNILLAPLTTFGIGGKAKFFVEVGSTDELTEAVKFAKNNNLAIFVLGGGSNILISDDGFDGLVIKNEIKGVKRKDTTDEVVLTVGAGEMWDDVVAKAVELNASGIENLSLIPGTVGGAVYQNIGAYGAEIKDVLLSVEVFDITVDKIVRLSNRECDFEYRSSIFKKDKNLIVLKAELVLSKNFQPNLQYPDLQKKFENKTPALSEVRNAVIEIRKNKIYYPEEFGNAGSFFKNPTIEMSNYQFLISKYPDLKGRDLGNGLVKLSAAQLIEKAGWKGKRFGNVGVADKHALVLVNLGQGKAVDISNLVESIRKDIRAKFGIELETEVEEMA